MAVHMSWIGALIILVVICGVVAVVAYWVASNRPPDPVTFPAMRETPLQILDRRFAAGEVSADDYKKARDLLTGGSPKP